MRAGALARMVTGRVEVVAVVVVAVVALAWHGVNGVRVTGALAGGARADEAAVIERRLNCLDRRVAELFEDGQRVHVEALAQADIDRVELYDRVVELVWRRGGVPVQHEAAAEVTKSRMRSVERRSR